MDGSELHDQKQSDPLVSDLLCILNIIIINEKAFNLIQTPFLP
jgi:hypothetical protein